MVFNFVIFLSHSADDNVSSHMKRGYYLVSQRGCCDRRIDEEPGDMNSSHTQHH